MTPSTAIEKHTIAVLVDNEPGVLARVIGLFSGRGYNIESLTVAETNAKENLSRITVVTSGTPMIIEQIKNQLDRLVPVHVVRDMTLAGAFVSRELALLKVAGASHLDKALRLAESVGARVIEKTKDSYVFEMTDSTERLDAFINQLGPLGLADVSRTGVVAMARGAETL